ncbi:IQ motif, EF-hand binding site [Dillenia turbinata]|uniref:IQ motif, EF-hand binding site n=1 Tax=Dillenia turbinata TaxID=194707 RepID=A0AAN8ZR63_9MAGN
MGRRKNWFSAVKLALNCKSKEKKDERTNKSKKKWFGKGKYQDPDRDSPSFEAVVNSPPIPPPVEVKLKEAENEQTKHAYSVAFATAVAAEAAVAAAEAAVEVVRLTTAPQSAGKMKEEAAAIKIQTAFRGYLARWALRALRGLVRLKSLLQGDAAKLQSTRALRSMQTFSHVQSQIRSRRIRMSEENQALQRQLLLKHAKELEKLQASEEWDDSLQSKEQIEANLLGKHEAAMRRERTLAYSFSHQQNWKDSSKVTNLLFMDPNNPQWGWSWLERWMAARTMESRAAREQNTDQSSVRMANRSMIGGEICRVFARHQFFPDKTSPTASQKSTRPFGHQSPSTPKSKAGSTISTSRKMELPSPKKSMGGTEDDLRSVISMQSEQPRRHSIGSSARDDESMASSPAIPSYMTPTKSARAKLKSQSPLSSSEKNMLPKKGSETSVKKRLSYPASPAQPRRHSGPPKVDTGIISAAE